MRYDCCSAEVIPSQTHSWENGACSVCGYACRHSGGEATCTTPLTCAQVRRGLRGEGPCQPQR